MPHELQGLIARSAGPSILDIGIVGFQPLKIWQPLLETYPTHFHVTEVDVWGIENASQIV
jgi:hypothetical protein